MCHSSISGFPSSKMHRADRHAFILTSSCRSKRFNTTVSNLEQAYPNFFIFHCYESIPLNDSHIHTSNDAYIKTVSSVLVSTVQIWSYEIPKYASDEFEWSFFFEDDINVINPKNANPVLSQWLNHTAILEELMNNDRVRKQDGLFYLGICGPEFNSTDQPFQAQHITNETIIHLKGYGFCAHALALTTRRAMTLWTDLSSYQPANYDSGIDRYLREYCIRSDSRFYVLGGNKQWPTSEEHFGLVFQDRGIFGTTVYGT